MSIALMTMVWQQGPSDRSQRLLMLALADCANDQGLCWPSTEKLAGKACMNVRTVLRTLKDLELAKWLTVARRSHERRGNTYQLSMEKLRSSDIASRDTVSHDNLSRDKTSIHEVTFWTSRSDKLNKPPDPLKGRTVKNHQEPSENSREDDGENDPCIAARLLSEESGNYDMRFQGDRAKQIQAEAKKRGITCRAVAESMVAQWRSYNASRPQLKFAIQSAEKFWTSGTWHDPQAWPWRDGHSPPATGKTPPDANERIRAEREQLAQHPELYRPPAIQ